MLNINEWINKKNVKQAVLIGSCNIYHTCCHNIIHEKNLEILKALYKQSVFVLQAKHFFDTSCYIVKKKDLLDKLGIEDKHILELYMNIKTMNKLDKQKFNQSSNELFTWSSKLIKK